MMVIMVGLHVFAQKRYPFFRIFGEMSLLPPVSYTDASRLAASSSLHAHF